MSRYRLEIYDDYLPEEIDKAINACIKDRFHRQLLHYKLIDNYSYEEIGEALKEKTGRFVCERTAKRWVYKAEKELYSHLQVIYRKN